MPSLDTILGLLRRTGFENIAHRSVNRNRELDIDEEVERVEKRERPSFRMLGDEELAAAVAAMRADHAQAKGAWTDPRPTSFITARR